MRPSEGPTSSMTRLNNSKSSMPAWRVRVMPVSGAQQAWAHEMLQAAVHSMYIRDGRLPAPIGRTVGVPPLAIGSLSGQSPQNFDPPVLRSALSVVMVDPVHTPLTDVC